MSSYRLNGWRHDLEDLDRLRDSLDSIQLLRAFSAVPYAYDEEVDYPWIRNEDQLQIGSCQGNALTSVGEIAYWNATGLVDQFSRWYAYRMSQIIDGITGDNGSTLEGGMKLARDYGFGLESTCPYPHSYVKDIPNKDKCLEEGKTRRIRKSMECENYDDVFQFIAKRYGAVQIGIAWPDAWFEPPKGPLEHYEPGRRAGGHSVYFRGYTKRLDSQGRHYLKVNNSWKIWGDENKGTKEVSPACVEQMFDYGRGNGMTVMIGHTDMNSPAPRRGRIKC